MRAGIISFQNMVQILKVLKRILTRKRLEGALDSNHYTIDRYNWALSSALNRTPIKQQPTQSIVSFLLVCNT